MPSEDFPGVEYIDKAPHFGPEDFHRARFADLKAPSHISDLSSLRSYADATAASSEYLYLFDDHEGKPLKRPARDSSPVTIRDVRLITWDETRQVHTSLKYLTVVSTLGMSVFPFIHPRYLSEGSSPSVLGNVFSNNRARSGSFNRDFMSVMTFCRHHFTFSPLSNHHSTCRQNIPPQPCY